MSTDIEIEHRLEDIEEKIDENSRILRSMKRKQLFDTWFGVIKVAIFIGGFYYAYQFAEPFVNQLKDTYIQFQGLQSSVDSFKGNSMFDFFRHSTSTPQ